MDLCGLSARNPLNNLPTPPDLWRVVCYYCTIPFLLFPASCPTSLVLKQAQRAADLHVGSSFCSLEFARLDEESKQANLPPSSPYDNFIYTVDTDITIQSIVLLQSWRRRRRRVQWFPQQDSRLQHLLGKHRKTNRRGIGRANPKLRPVATIASKFNRVLRSVSILYLSLV